MTDAPKIISPWGYPIPEKMVDESLVASLEDALERAKAGEVVGAVMALAHHDALSSYRIVGQIPAGYSLIGAVTLAARNLEHIVNNGGE